MTEGSGPDRSGINRTEVLTDLSLLCQKPTQRNRPLMEEVI